MFRRTRNRPDKPPRNPVKLIASRCIREYRRAGSRFDLCSATTNPNETIIHLKGPITMKTRWSVVLSAISLISATSVSQLPAHEPRWASFQEMHDAYTKTFAERPEFGISRLAAPQKNQMPRTATTKNAPASVPALMVAGKPVVVTNQSLIGLDRDEPIVFQTGNTSMMQRDLIDSYKKRELTEFESQAVERLRNGKSVTYQANPGKSGYTVIGALRAEESCAQCHDVPKGTLLGAFVFKLDRVDKQPIPSKPATQSAQQQIMAQQVE